MAFEAQKLISISLGKIAHSRSQRSGSSLHKSLLVATVLQKARHVFMEEAYVMYQKPNGQHHYEYYPPYAAGPPAPQQPIEAAVAPSMANECDEQESAHQVREEIVEAVSDDEDETAVSDSNAPHTCIVATPVAKEDEENEAEDEKENSGERTYLDLDACKPQQQASPEPLSDASFRHNSAVKRRRISEAETNEAVASILPKKQRTEESNTMEVEHITSLVSIFTFGGQKMTRSMSTPDLCSTQAKEGVDVVQRPVLALTV